MENNTIKERKTPQMMTIRGRSYICCLEWNPVIKPLYIF